MTMEQQWFARKPRRGQLAMICALIAAALICIPARGAEVGSDDLRVSAMAGIGNLTGAALSASAAYNEATDQYLLVWFGTEADVATTPNRIYGRLLNARTGAVIGSSQFLVAEVGGTDPELDATDPVVLYNSVANEYFVAFVGNPNASTTELDVFGQRVDGSGSRIGSPTQLSQCGVAGDTLADVGTTIDSAFDITYNATSNEYFVVYRCDDVDDGGMVDGEFDIIGQRISATGSPLLADDLQISFVGGANGSTNAQYDAESPAVTWNSDRNEYLVVWGADEPASGDGNREIYGRGVSASGTLLGSGATAISDTPVASRDSSTAEVVYNPVTDQYLVVWGSDRLTDNLVQVHGQFLNGATLAAVGTNDFAIGSNKTDATNPQVALVYNRIDDEFLVSWNRGGTATDAEVTVQRVDADGTPLGTNDQVISSMAFSLQGPSALGYSPVTNAYLATWAGSDDQGGQVTGENEIFVQLLSEPIDLAVTKSSSPARPAPGDTVTYTLTYVNNGPNRIVDVVLSDPLPAQLTNVSFSTSGVSGSTPLARVGSPYTFDIAQLLSGQGGTITISGQVVGTQNADGSFSGAPADGTLVNNTASISTPTASLDSNSANESASASFTVDHPPRVVSITRVNANPSNAASVQFLVSFSEAVTGGSTANFSLASSGVSGASISSVSGTGSSRTVTVNTGSGSGSIGLNLSSASGISDVSAGKALRGTLPVVGEVYTIDRTPPEVTINQAASQADPVNSGPILFDVVFSEAVNGFDSSDIAFTGSSAGGTLSASVSGSGPAYTVSVSGMSGDGTVVASVAANAAQDSVGNQSGASSSSDNSVSYDSTAPTVTINQASSQPDPSNTSPLSFEVVFAEPVTGFDGSDVSLGGSAGATTAVVTGSGASYTVAVSGMSSSGSVTASIAQAAASDLAGNPSQASSSSDNSIEFVLVANPLLVTINQAASQADPASSGPILFEVVFSRPVTGFDGSDVVLSGTAGATTAVVTGSGANYSVAVSGMSANGTVIASISANAAIDGNGVNNNGSSSSDNTVTYAVGVAPSLSVRSYIPSARRP